MKNFCEEKALGFEFKKMNNLIIRYIHGELLKNGFDEMTTMHGWILGYLYNNSEHDIYQKDLMDKFQISKSTVTNILNLMEKKGYLQRKSDLEDGRLKRIELTELGISVHMETVKIIDRLHEQMEIGITEEEKKVFYSVTEKMKNNMINKTGGQ